MIADLWGWFEEGNAGNPLVVAPTGSGKSVLIAAIMEKALKGWPDQRIAMVTHQKELIEQNYAKLMALWPEAPAGIYSAGIGRKDANAQILFAGIQSVWRKPAEIGHLDLVLIDEAHLLNPRRESMYRTFLQWSQSANPYLRVIGLTATHFRLDHGFLHRGKDAFFSGIAAEVGIQELLKAGYLCRIVSKESAQELDTRGIRKQRGEFVAADVEERMFSGGYIYAALDDLIQRGAGRKSWLIFLPGVEVAQKAAAYLNDAGIAAACVHGGTPKKEREQLLEDFKAGRYRAVTNVNVLTTGFDNPSIDLIAMMRPTMSTGLYIQMAGRGLRIAPGKESAQLLDYVGNVTRHGLIDDPDIYTERKGGGPAPTKKCPECKARAPLAARSCGACGFIWPEPEKHPTTFGQPYEGAILSSDAGHWAEVGRMDLKYWRPEYRLPQKATPSMRVTYYGPGNLSREIASEWVCFEHSGYARSQAAVWDRRHRVGVQPTPETVKEALEREYKTPKAIMIKKKGKYWEILSKKF